MIYTSEKIKEMDILGILLLLRWKIFLDIPKHKAEANLNRWIRVYPNSDFCIQESKTYHGQVYNT